MLDATFPVVSRLTLSRGQVAELLGLSETTFKKRQPTLEGFGFPGKLPGMNAWSRPAVVDWISTNGNTYPAPAIEPVKIAAIDSARSALEREYAA